MGFLDDVLNKSLPQGSGLAKPLMLAFVALLASGALTRKQAPASAPTLPPTTGADTGGLLGGLSGLLEKLQQGNLGDVATSWVGNGQNQPISPGSLGPVLGPSIVKTLAEKTGLSEQEVTAQLSQVLPGFVDKLTPQGRLPTQDELAQLSG